MAEDMDVGTDKLQDDIEERRKEADGERRERDGRPLVAPHAVVSAHREEEPRAAVRERSFAANSLPTAILPARRGMIVGHPTHGRRALAITVSCAIRTHARPVYPTAATRRHPMTAFSPRAADHHGR